MANMFAKLCKALLHEFHTSVGRIGTARTKPIVEALSGFSDEAQQGMVAFLSPFLWVIAFLAPCWFPQTPLSVESISRVILANHFFDHTFFQIAHSTSGISHAILCVGSALNR